MNILVLVRGLAQVFGGLKALKIANLSSYNEIIDEVFLRQSLADLKTREDILNADLKGWTKSLTKQTAFTHKMLENQLVRNSRTMPDKIAPKRIAI